MKRKIFSKLLMGAFLIASVSMFVSCKDYDDDISKTNQDITALKSQLSTLESSLTSQLNSAKSDLASAKTALEAAIAAKADASTVSDLSKNVTDAIGRISALETQIATLDEYAKKVDLAAYAKTDDVNEALGAYAKTDAVQALIAEAIATVTGDIQAVKDQIPSNEELVALIAQNAAAKTLESQVAALENFQKEVAAANYLQADDLKGINDEIANLKKQIAEIKIPEAVDIEAIQNALAGQFQTLSEDINKNLTSGLNIIYLFVNKKLTAAVLMPNFYWEGIEAIEVPFGKSPVFEQVDEDYKFQYQLLDKPGGEQLVDVTVKQYMKWAGTDENREYGIYVNAAVPASHALTPAANANKMQYTSFGFGATARYHLNPSIADIEGATLGFYENDAPVYTRTSGSIEATPYETTFDSNGKYNKIENGILSIPFYVKWDKVKEYFDNWTATNRTVTDPTWDNENDEAGSPTGHYSYGYASSANDAKLPFISLKVDVPAKGEGDSKQDAYSVNSDYAVVVPGLYEIVAIADKAPEEKGLAQNTFKWEDYNKFTPAQRAALLPHEIRKNHLYETVGYKDHGIIAEDANNGKQGWNEAPRYGAIPMPATHSVPYNGEIDLLDYVETHFNYTTFAQYGKSFTDEVLDTYNNGQVWKDLGLHYEFTIVHYFVGNEETSESAHIHQFESEKYPGNKSLFKPVSIVLDENQKWIDSLYTYPATREVVDREPLIRVDLKTSEDKIIRYGYIKLRITETAAETKDKEITLNLDDMYMNCGDEGKVKWSQIERLILKELGTEGYTKQEFERDYKLDVYGNYAFMPFIDPSKVAGDTDPAGPLYTGTWMAKRFYRKSGMAPLKMAECSSADYAVAISGTAITDSKEDIAKFTNTNNHFGEVWYTPHDNSTDGHNWDEQTNVLIWNLHQGTVPRNAVTTVTADKAGNMDKAKYDRMRDVLGALYGNQGTSQKDLATTVRFVNKNTGRNIYVTLRVPANHVFFEYGKIDNKDWSHWFKFNANNYNGSYGTLEGESATQYPYWSEFDTRINPFKPSNVGYLFLDAETTKKTSLVQKLSDHWMNPGEMVVLEGVKAKFTKFYTTNPVVSFSFTIPVEGNNSNAGKAAEARTIQLDAVNPQWSTVKTWENAWTVEGASGTIWTLVVGSHKNGPAVEKGIGKGAVSGDAIFAVGKKIVGGKAETYGPEEIAYLDGTFTASNGNVINDVDLHYHGLETPGLANLYPAATDLINKSGAYDEAGLSRFELNSGLTNLTKAEFFEQNINEAFTAYIKIGVTHDCYDPLIDKQFFNVRFHRPINVIAKEYVWDDQVLNDNYVSIKDLVEMIDWNNFPLVAYNSGAISARNNMFGVAFPKYSDVFGDATHVKAQNKGLPYEFYGISELAVRYDEIRTDHAKQPGVRNNAKFNEAWILNPNNTDLVKNVPSLFSERQTVTDANGTKYRTVTLLNADNTVVDFNTRHAYNHSKKNAQGSYEYGRLYYNNDASDVQMFHFYIPIAVKYNWGNIAWDDTLNDQPGVKLDDDYTQTVWAVITVKGTH